MSSPLVVQQIPGGPLETNAFLVIDPPTSSALLIDAPPDTHDAVVAAVQAAGASVDTIVLTHTHWDHIVDTAPLRSTLGARVLAHPRADSVLENPADIGIPIEPVTPDGHLDDGDTLALGERTFVVYHLPGHDPSHIALYSADDGIMLSGDVLFPGGHGRTDIPGADQDTMLQSLARLLELPDHVTVYPGHGKSTTIGDERSWMVAMTQDIS